MLIKGWLTDNMHENKDIRLKSALYILLYILYIRYSPFTPMFLVVNSIVSIHIRTQKIVKEIIHICCLKKVKKYIMLLFF